MKKYLISISIMFLVGSAFFHSSCTKSDIEEIIEEQLPEILVFVEDPTIRQLIEDDINNLVSYVLYDEGKVYVAPENEMEAMTDLNATEAPPSSLSGKRWVMEESGTTKTLEVVPLYELDLDQKAGEHAIVNRRGIKCKDLKTGDCVKLAGVGSATLPRDYSLCVKADAADRCTFNSKRVEWQVFNINSRCTGSSTPRLIRIPVCTH